MVNEKIKQYMKDHGVFQWQVAAALGISESTLVKKLRFELSAEDHEKIVSLVDMISNSKEENK